MPLIQKVPFKSRLQAGAKLTGCWLEMFSPVAGEIVARAGYTAAIIDLEHGPGSYLDALKIMPALEANGCAPVIRVPFAHEAEIKRAMDLGPAAVMIPNIRSAEEARRMVRASRYGPLGNRGAAPGMIRASGYGGNRDEYAAFLQQEFLLIGQIESTEALEQVEEIASVDGLDMIFPGPSDLSASLGDAENFHAGEFQAGLEKIEQAAGHAGKLLGSITFPARSAEDLFAAGYRFVASGCDTLLLQAAALSDVAYMGQIIRDSGSLE